jgi:hypothetical protein
MPDEITRELVKCEAALYSMQEKYPTLAKAAANARYIYDMAWANAIDDIAHRTLAEGQKAPTVALMDAMATKMVAEQMESARVTESDLDAAKKHLDTLQAILSSVQTRAKIVLAQMSLK